MADFNPHGESRPWPSTRRDTLLTIEEVAVHAPTSIQPLLSLSDRCTDHESADEAMAPHLRLLGVEASAQHMDSAWDWD